MIGIVCYLRPDGPTVRYRRFLAARTLSLAAFSLAVLLLAGCNRSPAEGAGSPSRAGGLVPVTVASVVQEDVPIQVRAIGWGEAYNTVTIKARVEGQLTGVHFGEGQTVKTGDLLFTIDPRPFEVAVRLAQANLARDQALAEDAERNAQWVADLYRQGQGAQREVDESRAQADAKQAAVRADQAALEQAELQLGFCTIRGPIDGRTGDLLTDRGSMVKANDTTLVTIEQTRPIYVSFSVPEVNWPLVQEYMAAGELAVEAAIPGDSRPPQRGTLTFLDNRVDRTTGTIRLKGTFENADERLWPGQFVNVTLTLAMQRDAVVVPSEALQTSQKGPIVFVVKEDQTVELRPVVTARQLDGRTVIESGLRPGEIVVTDGHLRLAPGAKVGLKPATTRPGGGA